MSAFVPLRSEDSGEPVGPRLRGRNHAHYMGKSLAMDAPMLFQREPLVTVRLEAKKGTDLVEEAAEARSGAEGFEPSGDPIALLNAPMVLLNGLITNDKFCMSRISPSRMRWARRPPQRRAPPAMTDYLHNDSEHCGGSHETPVAHPASVPGGRGRRAAMGSGLPTPASLELAPRVPSRLSTTVASTTRGGTR
jgi:hypothetical protein